MFTSFYFIIFLVILSLIYFAAPKSCRPVLLLASSYLFCAGLGLNCLIILLLLTVFTFFAALVIEKLRLKKHTLQSRCVSFASIAFCVLLMAGFKYIPWLLQISGRASLFPERLTRLAVPIGLSFYLFQSIGYLADVSRGKYSASEHFVSFGLYMAYFPKFVSGPIERFPDFSAQLKELKEIRFWDRGRLSCAFTYMLYGYFMKLVVADRLSPIVSGLFEAPGKFDSFFLLMGAFFYTVQIYCDFAGYSFIAIGCSRLFGISLTANFITPYFARNITDFWRRWHVSLSCWLRDYIYIPLGGNRKGLLHKCVNTLIVFLICGMWHGAGFNFIAWGLLHGFYSIADTLLRKKEIKLPFSSLITFVEVSAAWVFFRATSLSSASGYFIHMASLGLKPGRIQAMLGELDLCGIEIAVTFAAILIVFLMDYQGCRHHLLFPELVQEKKNSVRYLIFYVLIVLLFIFGVYGPGYHTEQFIYMQF